VECSENAVGACAKADDLLSAGRTEDACAVLRPLLSAYPENPIVHLLFARTSAGLGDAHSAAIHFQRALMLEPNLIGAHLHYAELLARRGDVQQALQHVEAGYKRVHTWESHYSGSADPLRVLQIGSAVADGLTETEYILGQGWFQTTTIVVQYWQRGRGFPPHDIVFNSVADPDRCGAALDVAEWVLSQTSAPILNSPQAIRGTGRVSAAQRLAGIPNVIVPRIRRFRRRAVIAGQVDFAKEGFTFPLLLRQPGDHNGRNFRRVESPDAAAEAANALAGEDVFALEFVDTRRDGRFWKYRAMIVDGDVFPAHLAISNAWNVHYFSAQMNENERAQEALFLEDMGAALGAPAMNALRVIASRLGLDYAGIDFGLNDRGEVVVFEANAAMTVFVPPESPQTHYRREAAFRIFSAARRMIEKRIAGSPR